MKSLILLFLLICTDAFSASLTRHGTQICGYGYRRQNSECVTHSTSAPECDSPDNSTAYYKILATSDVFSFKSGSSCTGNYLLYTYNPEFFKPIKSTGVLYAYGTSASLCGYNQYMLNGVCYSFSDPDAIGFCKENFHISSAVDASFIALRNYDPVCLGNYDKYTYSDYLQPIYNGTFLEYGSALYVTDEMTAQKCTVNPENYYKIGIDTTVDYFSHPERGICIGNTEKFLVDTDCKDINPQDKSQLAANQVCGVLCNAQDAVYTNSGVCSAKGYCVNGDKKMRLYVARPDGEKYSYPLYVSKTSTPAMHFKFLDKVSNEERMCYVNLVPPEAINHFVGQKPNPIRTRFINTNNETETLITID